MGPEVGTLGPEVGSHKLDIEITGNQQELIKVYTRAGNCLMIFLRLRQPRY